MSRIELPDFAVTRSTGFVAGAIAICTDADALVFFAGSAGNDTSIDGVAEASFTPSTGAGATLSGAAAANRSLNITEGTAATVSFFGTAAVACGRSANAVGIMAAGVLPTIRAISRFAVGCFPVPCLLAENVAPE